MLALAPPSASAQGENGNVLIYSGTTGYRHEGGSQAIPPNGEATGAVAAIQEALTAAGYTSDYRTCNGTGTGAGAEPGCRNPDVGNPAVFTEENLAQYTRSCSSAPPTYFSGHRRHAGSALDGRRGGGDHRLRPERRRDRGAPQLDRHGRRGDDLGLVGREQRELGGRHDDGRPREQRRDRRGHGPGPEPPVDRAASPDTFDVTDEHYNWDRNVRGDHHVLANFDERTYNPGPNGMGQDHPISWCRSYDGDNVNDATGTPKAYDDGRAWIIGDRPQRGGLHGERRRQPVLDHVVGGIRWASGEGKKSDCGGTVWSNYTRTVLVSNAQQPDRDRRGGRRQGLLDRDRPDPGLHLGGLREDARPRGRTEQPDDRRDDPDPRRPLELRGRRPGDEPRARDSTSSDPTKRDIFIYYSPRNPGLAHVGQRLHGRLQPDQPLHDDRRRHRVRGRLRAADPPGAEGEARAATRPGAPAARGATGPATSAAPAWSSTRTATSTSASATTSRRTRAGTAPIRRSTTARRSTATRARPRRTPTTCAARSSGSTRSTTSQRGPSRGSGRPTRSRTATCSRREPPTRGPRSTRWASGSRSPCTPTRRTRAPSPSASTATTRARTRRTGRRPAAASGT